MCSDATVLVVVALLPFLPFQSSVVCFAWSLRLSYQWSIPPQTSARANQRIKLCYYHQTVQPTIHDTTQDYIFFELPNHNFANIWNEFDQIYNKKCEPKNKAKKLLRKQFINSYLNTVRCHNPMCDECNNNNN